MFVLDVLLERNCRQVVDFACVALVRAIVIITRSGRVHAHMFLQAARFLKCFTANLAHIIVSRCRGRRRMMAAIVVQTLVMVLMLCRNGAGSN